jgi:peroxiredoxin Q/BCP
VKANADFARKYDFGFPLLCDTDRRLGMAYGACEGEHAVFARRITYVIDSEGRILLAYPTVDARRHPAKVLQDLRERIGAGA